MGGVSPVGENHTLTLVETGSVITVIILLNFHRQRLYFYLGIFALCKTEGCLAVCGHRGLMLLFLMHEMFWIRREICAAELERNNIRLSCL